MFTEGKTVDISSIKTRSDPVSSESDLMTYVGVSELVFNSAAMSLYKSGPFKLEVSEVRTAENQNLQTQSQTTKTGQN